jgi:hypothetical protein
MLGDEDLRVRCMCHMRAAQPIELKAKDRRKLVAQLRGRSIAAPLDLRCCIILLTAPRLQ